MSGHEDASGLYGREHSQTLSDPENYPYEVLAPYEEFTLSANTYYFTPGGFLSRKDPGTEEVGCFFYGSLADEVRHHSTDDG